MKSDRVRILELIGALTTIVQNNGNLDQALNYIEKWSGPQTKNPKPREISVSAETKLNLKPKGKE